MAQPIGALSRWWQRHQSDPVAFRGHSNVEVIEADDRLEKFVASFWLNGQQIFCFRRDRRDQAYQLVRTWERRVSRPGEAKRRILPTLRRIVRRGEITRRKLVANASAKRK